MTEDQIRQIIREEVLNILGDYSHIPLQVENALVRRGFFKLPPSLGTGIVKSNGDGTFTVVVGASKGVYVSATPAGSPTNFMQVSSGVITSI